MAFKRQWTRLDQSMADTLSAIPSIAPNVWLLIVKTRDDFGSLNIVDFSNNEVLAGTSASSYSCVLEQLKARCPEKVQ